jgi:hypothetical protein
MIDLKQNRYAKGLLVIVMISFFTSCEKEEVPVPAHDAGGVITNSVAMEVDYRNQIYFDLETNSMVKKNLKTNWDLGFESSEGGSKIILNSAKLMYSANTYQTDFLMITDTAGLTFKWDAASGKLDSTAIDEWSASQYVYVIDRGFNELGIHLGFKKVLFQSVNTIEYQLKFSNLDGTNEINRTVLKDNAYNFSFLSLDNKIVNVEPKKEAWDISFTQYTHVFAGDPPTPYLVTGVLTNRNKVEVATVFNKQFTDIVLSDVALYSFSTTIDKIGYDWKEYNFTGGSYTVFSDKNYIIKSTEEKYYKLHFIDFYDAKGDKGNPTFEFQEL